MVYSQHVSPLEKLTSERFVFYLLAWVLYADIASVLINHSSLISLDAITQLESLLPYAAVILLSYIFLAGYILPVLHSLLLEIAVMLCRRRGEEQPKNTVGREDLVKFAVRHNNLAAYELARQWTQIAEVKRSVHFAAFSVLCFGAAQVVLAVMGYTPLLRDAIAQSSRISRPLSITVLVVEIIFFLHAGSEVFSIRDWTTEHLRVGSELKAYIEAESNGGNGVESDLSA